MCQKISKTKSHKFATCIFSRSTRSTSGTRNTSTVWTWVAWGMPPWKSTSVNRSSTPSTSGSAWPRHRGTSSTLVQQMRQTYIGWKFPSSFTCLGTLCGRRILNLTCCAVHHFQQSKIQNTVVIQKVMIYAFLYEQFRYGSRFSVLVRRCVHRKRRDRLALNRTDRSTHALVPSQVPPAESSARQTG